MRTFASNPLPSLTYILHVPRRRLGHKLRQPVSPTVEWMSIRETLRHHQIPNPTTTVRAFVSHSQLPRKPYHVMANIFNCVPQISRVAFPTLSAPLAPNNLNAPTRYASAIAFDTSVELLWVGSSHVRPVLARPYSLRLYSLYGSCVRMRLACGLLLAYSRGSGEG